MVDESLEWWLITRHVWLVDDSIPFYGDMMGIFSSKTAEDHLRNGS